jgi:hypothetical protein
MNANSDREYIDTKASDLRMVMDASLMQSRAEFEARIDRSVAHLVKWVVGLFVTSVAVNVALNVALASMLMNVILKVSVPSAAQAVAPAYVTPSVSIQLTPQSATVLPAAPPAGKP